MERKKVYYKPRGSPRRRAGKRGRGAGEGVSGAKLAVFALLIVFSIALRFSERGPLFELKQGVSDLLDAGPDYSLAIAVLGQAFSKESDSGQRLDAVLTFGRDLLGLPDPSPNVFEELEPGDLDAQQPEDTQNTDALTSAGGDSGRYPVDEHAAEVFMVEPQLYYIPEPQEADVQVLISGLDEEEWDDQTPNELFEIPYPDNASKAAPALPFKYQAPLFGEETSGFGYRIHPISGNTTFHYGLDIAAVKGARVNAFAAGTVRNAGFNSVYGNYVRIEHSGGFVTFYGHLDKIAVKEGAKVKLGQKIGTAGSTGQSTGCHLHFEVRTGNTALNPKHYV